MNNQPQKIIDTGRRNALKAAGVGVLAIAGASLTANVAQATPEEVATALAKLTGGVTPQSGKITLKLPEIAENGASVPVTLIVDSPMTADNYVKQIHLLAEGNPTPEVVSFYLTPAAGKADISTRMRLGQTQKVVAAAVMSDGSVYSTSKEVKVTIGGCGG
ncbi:thiosulfate oxidation carrier protein SoxY [Varunaivibrio sulfuroxidans]|uniref:Thiosulfate-binding protein SoxY n=1 Tax=Varunaivibrio sulfuroxidans TaxID=1773489 RepID=A0A4R3JFN5_9PROT|nr:thiosulfate oxidation carrier protein SoxY [Varunaivibrio sulfuroxidans]TCS64305.1 thiosulfate-binding protein SoxY [Varunaivibrio sulfuroxidans]WES31259.1 thiosulfate oxidation carrier protein SoxY [Varunaivibrio sulfuroxidans]